MARTVQCVVLKKEAEGLDKPMHPGELGERIFENVSKDGWKQWLERLTTIINENGLSTADIEGVELIEKHMRGGRRLWSLTGRFSSARCRGQEIDMANPERPIFRIT